MAERMTPVVIDANIAVALVVTLPWSGPATAWIEHWQSAQVSVYVPMLWEHEVVATLRKVQSSVRMNQEEALRAMGTLLQLSVQRILPDPALHHGALQWAGRLRQCVAYDAQYLALAERLGAEFRTADRRLAERAHECGAGWVHLITEGSDVPATGDTDG
jgi:predicted nucleic acid-binding protein